MLAWQFYSLNATTLLLWLLQNCSHEVLLLLIVLGAICVLVSSIIIVSRLVNTTLRIFFTILNIIIRCFINYFTSNQRIALVRNLRQPRRNLPTSIGYTNHRMFLSNRNLPLGPLDNAHAALSDGELTLPQSLALHPVQWTALEFHRTQATCAEATCAEATPVNSTPQPPPLRRSRRSQHARTQNCC